MSEEKNMLIKISLVVEREDGAQCSLVTTEKTISCDAPRPDWAIATSLRELLNDMEDRAEAVVSEATGFLLGRMKL